MAGGACVAGETATAADGAHPTGMHSSYAYIPLFVGLRRGIWCILSTLAFYRHAMTQPPVVLITIKVEEIATAVFTFVPIY